MSGKGRVAAISAVDPFAAVQQPISDSQVRPVRFADRDVRDWPIGECPVSSEVPRIADARSEAAAGNRRPPQAFPARRRVCRLAPKPVNGKFGSYALNAGILICR